MLEQNEWTVQMEHQNMLNCVSMVDNHALQHANKWIKWNECTLELEAQLKHLAQLGLGWEGEEGVGIWNKLAGDIVQWVRAQESHGWCQREKLAPTGHIGCQFPPKSMRTQRWRCQRSCVSSQATSNVLDADIDGCLECITPVLLYRYCSHIHTSLLTKDMYEYMNTALYFLTSKSSCL